MNIPKATMRTNAERPACLAIVVLSLITCVFCLQASGQSYSSDSYSINGGGGTSTGGIFTVSGTIGQPDAGAMTGGNYSLTGGFWSLISAIQTAGAPYLSVTPTSTNTVCVWWAVSDTSWQLQGTSALAGSNTVWSTYTYMTNGDNCVFVEPLPVGSKFYRLKH